MNKAIFLVEEINNGKPVSLLEKLYAKLIKDSHHNNAYFGYIEEVPAILAGASGFITFKSVYDFVKETEQNGLPDNTDIFYFISAWQEIKTFRISNLLTLDPAVRDFLVKHQVPIVIDASIESGHIYRDCEDIFEHNWDEFVGHRRGVWRGLENLPYYIVTAGIVNGSSRTRRFDVRYRMFTGSFFHKVYEGHPLHDYARQHRDRIFDEIDNRKITDTTPVWQAFQRSPRISKILFQLLVEQKKLTNFGSYSRARGCKDEYLRMHERLNLSTYNLPTSGELVDSLNDIKVIIDTPPDLGPGDQDQVLQRILDGGAGVFETFPMSSMFHVVLETCCMMYESDFNNSPSQLTEKSSLAIFSGMPFIPCGGHRLGDLMKAMGFKEYPGLEFPTQPNYMDEVNYVVSKIENIVKMSVKEKQKLYDSWKDILKYNYDHMLNLNAQEMYLKFLNTELDDLR